MDMALILYIFVGIPVILAILIYRQEILWRERRNK